MRSSKTLSFDGKGINGPDEYRSRIATFASGAYASEYGPMFEAAPETMAALSAALDDLESALPTLRAAGWQTHNEEATIRRGRAAIAKATGE